jgi:hypothetical protein
MSIIRRSLVFGALLLAATSAAAFTGALETSHTFEARPDARVVVEATSHEVVVTSRPGSTVEVSVRIEVSGSEAKVKNVLNELTPVFEDRGSELVIRSKRAGSGWTGWGSIRIDGVIEVSMPADMDLSVDVGSGRVSMLGDFGNATLEADTGSGSVRLEGAARVLVADTGSGSVEAKVTRPLERFAADTGSGGVRLEGGADQASADTGSG